MGNKLNTINVNNVALAKPRICSAPVRFFVNENKASSKHAKDHANSSGLWAKKSVNVPSNAQAKFMVATVLSGGK